MTSMIRRHGFGYMICPYFFRRVAAVQIRCAARLTLTSVHQHKETDVLL